jgi:hypothetical protein
MNSWVSKKAEPKTLSAGGASRSRKVREEIKLSPVGGEKTGISRNSTESLVGGEPDPSGFNQGDKDADDEVKILGGRIAGRRGQLDAAAAEESIKLAFLLHNHGCQRPMKDSDGHAQHQSGDFYDHMDLV